MTSAAIAPSILFLDKVVSNWMNYEIVKSPAMDEYLDINAKFAQFHQNPTNVLIHLVTTPLGFVGLFGLLRQISQGSTISLVICMIYMLSLVRALPVGVFIGTWISCIIIGTAAKRLQLGVKSSIAMIVVGYILQDLAHLATSEATYQSSYSNISGTSSSTQIDTSNIHGWFRLFLEHCYYLIPLCIHSYINVVAAPLLTATVGASTATSILNYIMYPLPPQLQHIYTFAYILTPLFCISFGSYCIDSRNGFCFFPGAPYFSRIVQCNLVTGDSNCRKNDLKAIRDWVLRQMPSHATSSHWWFKQLASTEYNAFDRIAHSDVIINAFRKIFDERHYALEIVEGMNEIYVSGPPRDDEALNSDHVFYSRHVDGPLGFIPYVSVYRCIVGMDRNMMITTHFPIAGLSHNATNGDVLGFDFNREIHYISMDPSKKDISDEFRVVLKLHYCVYPRILAPLGWIMHALNVRYNQAFRALFLKTINPVTPYEHFLAWNVVFNTALFDFIETFLGQRSVFYIVFAGTLWYITGLYEIFFVMTSFVHYIRYITTFYLRRGIDFGSFKRDVLLFKSLALFQLFFMYFCPTAFKGYNPNTTVLPFEWDVVSIAMIIGGYTISALATKAIGIDRTYFGSELGLVPPKWIDQFPYGYIPHPMIVGQIIALLGVYKAQHLRTLSPYVIPMHIFLYVVHMLQEEFNIYDHSVDCDKKAYQMINNNNNNSDANSTACETANDCKDKKQK